MQYVEYGKTGKRVSVVGFGGMRFDKNRSDHQNAELVRYAAERGINYFDTAPGYGRSEDIFGLAFGRMPGEFYVSTKLMPTQVSTAAKARKAVRKSLQRMGVAKIDFFHVWCLRKMEHYELAVRPGGLYEGLRQCQQQGLIDHIVCSSHQPGEQIKRILGDGKFEGVTLGVNVLNHPYRWDGVRAAAEAGLGVAAMNPLGGGLIPKHHKELAFLGSQDETPTEAALRFVISCPQINVALVGFTQPEHVEAACRVAQRAQPLDQQELTRIRQHLGRNMTSVCTACGYCEGCPMEIPVVSYMQFYNGKAMFGKTDEQMQKSLGVAHGFGVLAGRRAEAGACTQCGACEEACTQQLDVIQRLREIAAWEKARLAGVKGWLRRIKRAVLRRT